jgi:hypothetical protein
VVGLEIEAKEIGKWRVDVVEEIARFELDPSLGASQGIEYLKRYCLGPVERCRKLHIWSRWYSHPRVHKLFSRECLRCGRKETVVRDLVV